MDSATASVERLDRVVPPVNNETGTGQAGEDGDDDESGKKSSSEGASSDNAKSKSKGKGKGDVKNNEDMNTDSAAVVEIGPGEDEEAELERLQKLDERKNDVLRIRAKALMRRARAKSQLGGWANLQGAEEDYKTLAAMETLPPEDRRIVQKALRELPERINGAREKEMADMMGKLKEVSVAFCSVVGNISLTIGFLAGSWGMGFLNRLACLRRTSSSFRIRIRVVTV